MHTCPGGQERRLQYRYDALGRRILARTRRANLCGGHASCHGAITRYVWDGDALLWELRAEGENNVTGWDLEATTGPAPYYGRVAYVHGLEIDRPLAVIGSAGLIIPHLNWRGLYDRATTPAGALFISGIDWPGLNRMSYHDEEFDSKPTAEWWGSLILDQKDATGLLYRRNRYYDPGTGRFTQEDPIGLAGGLNTYGFADGDPVNFSDPFGLMAIDHDVECPGCAGAAWGASLGTVVLPGVGTIIGGAIGAVTATAAGVLAARLVQQHVFNESDDRRADEIISADKKGSIRRQFPGEMLGKTREEIDRLAKQGDRSAQTARKLLNDRRFNKDDS